MRIEQLIGTGSLVGEPTVCISAFSYKGSLGLMPVFGADGRGIESKGR